MSMKNPLEERLRTYSKPLDKSHWQGASRGMEDIDRWSQRASENSDGWKHRAMSGEIELPPTGRQIETRDTAMAPRVPRNANRAMVNADMNDVGSSFMPGVRRTTI
jgi:hypothetical protein